MRLLAARSTLACALALLVAAPAAGAQGALTKVDAESLVRELRAGRKVSRDHLRVDGRLDLSGLESVRRLFKCRECVFEDDVLAQDVTFERIVDLSGSTFEGDVVFRGATFRGPALFRATTDESEGTGKPLSVVGKADFSLAFFDDFASFGGSTFDDDAIFRDARFADAAFGSTIFRRAVFDRAAFRGSALFNGAVFEGPATFSEADFRGRADFSQALFRRGGAFTGAQFARGASFLAARFFTVGATKTEPIAAEAGAWFQALASVGDLDFTFAEFLADEPPPRDDARVAVFENVIVGGSVGFREATFDEIYPIKLTRLQARALVLDVHAVGRIENELDRREALKMIEDSAKARDDLQVANDAHYELRILRAEGFPRFWRWVDYVFYRSVAGYLVRPLHPLVVLGVLGMLLALARFLWPDRARAQLAWFRARLRRAPAPVPESDPAPDAVPEPASARGRKAGRLRAALVGFGNLLECALDTFARAVPQWGRKDPPTTAERFERLVYRLLVVCALIGLANSNPTLRQMVDTLF
jgi:uncharacterized protein YjbI with pentapeptide repeats